MRIKDRETESTRSPVHTNLVCYYNVVSGITSFETRRSHTDRQSDKQANKPHRKVYRNAFDGIDMVGYGCVNVMHNDKR